MRKKSLYEHTKDPKVHQSIDSLIMKLSSEYKSGDIEADIIALFEDIIMFFSGREEDFINLSSMPEKEKEALYAEIKLIIEILRKLRHAVDRQETIRMLSKNLIKTFSKSAIKKGYVVDPYEIFTVQEQERIKQEFIRITMEILRNKKLESYKSIPIKIEKKSVAPQHLKGRPKSSGIGKSF